MKVVEYARQFFSLLSYDPHVANQDRTKINKFLRGLKPKLFRMVLAGSPTTYAEDMDRAVDIEESLLEAQNQVQLTAGRTFQPVLEVMHPFQPPQTSQQSNHQRFKPRGKQFKKWANSSSSGSVSSGSNGSGGVTCGQCGGRHMTSQCRGVQGLCHNCGQPVHFARVCSLVGGQSMNQSQQGSAGRSSQRQQPFVQYQGSGFQPREPSRFGGPLRPQFPGPLR
ncbi:hypothetical protein F511_08021 [Dorcoceras hygrometricum]|uniref:CCHC-type domain-containing protein n=1 Tax=Dorcoceras hygrometricum TaxID=472368 RepID=A0A2Z7CZQ7_9LAMI|nr:hypothetical protein F511_08021 [Dorcoceras hygrometricum]